MPRQIRIEGDLAFIPLPDGREAVIDAADVHLVDAVSWHTIEGPRTSYARGNVRKPGGGYRGLLLHRAILDVSSDVCVDHKDGNGLNCRRYNIRLATTAENNRNSRRRTDNTSGVKGVDFNRSKGRWIARISVDGKRVQLGHFHNLEAAAEAYADASRKYHGKFGRTA